MRAFGFNACCCDCRELDGTSCTPCGATEEAAALFDLVIQDLYSDFGIGTCCEDCPDIDGTYQVAHHATTYTAGNKVVCNYVGDYPFTPGTCPECDIPGLGLLADRLIVTLSIYYWDYSVFGECYTTVVVSVYCCDGAPSSYSEPFLSVGYRPDTTVGLLAQFRAGHSGPPQFDCDETNYDVPVATVDNPCCFRWGITPPDPLPTCTLSRV